MPDELPRGTSVRGAAGTADITPDRPVRLAGMARRRVLSVRASEKLSANAMLFEDSRGRLQGILSLDLLFAGPDLTDRLRSFAAQELNIAKGDLLIAASHTHSAPPVDRRKPALGPVDDGYLEWVTERCCELLRSVAAQRREPLCFRGGIVEWHGAVYRRRYWPVPHLTREGPSLRGIVLAPDHDRSISRDVRMLEVMDDAGRSGRGHLVCRVPPDRLAEPARAVAGLHRDRARSPRSDAGRPGPGSGAVPAGIRR